MTTTLIRKCGLVSLLCSAWNLFGDLYFLDFYVAHMDDERFAKLRSEPRPGNLFDFFDDPKQRTASLFLAQAGGWMYPLWAFATAAPLYIGLRDAGIWHGLGPCVGLAYGLFVVGGALHSAFAFLTVVPSIYLHPPADDFWQPAVLQFADSAQTQILRLLFVGCLPGYVACNVAAVWIAFVVQFKPTKFPKWIHFSNPFVTMMWVATLGAMIPDPWGFYVVGSLGTWGIMFLNLAVSYCLWDDASAEDMFPVFTDKGPRGGYESLQ